MFPMVPLAWALRSAGHEVLLVTGGRGLGAAVKSGLPVVDYAPGMSGQEISDSINRQFPAHLPVGESRIRRLADAAERVVHIARFGLDTTIRIAEAWRPDLVVHDPLNAAGLIAAAKLGIPAVQHLLGFARGAGLSTELYGLLRADFTRHGAPGLPASVVLDVAPPALLAEPPEGWSMRYLPHDGGGPLASWLLDSAGAARPLIAVTLGTETPLVAGTGTFDRIAAAAERVDADFVFALGGADPVGLGALPPNVRAKRWLPFSELLTRCTAAVHHGGSGVTLSTLAAGVPQLALPNGADRHANAGAVAEYGAGLACAPDEVTPAVLARLATDEKLRQSAVEARAAIEAMPCPADLVPRLEAAVR